MPTLRFGGSFNPIHHAHLICARAVAEARGYDRVELIPTAQPPHKLAGTDMVPGSARFAMCLAAIGTSPLFGVNDIEMIRGGASYTIDTAREFNRRGEGPVDWLIGADMLLYLPKWHRSLELLNEVTFMVMSRPGWRLDWGLLPAEYRHLEANVVQTPLIEVSSSDIRARVTRGLSIDYLTPEPVCRYIRDHGLYR